ncbi:hypothetical protein [Ruminococcus sp.]|uniref:hypothetical protein n=1 Tax=Ruminococcus sp. TaxID=41978 RepID=UPI00388F0D1C
MQKKNFIALIILISLLAISILLMSISLLLSERVFGQVSSYIAIACVIITLIGVAIIIINNRKHKDDDDIDR